MDSAISKIIRHPGASDLLTPDDLEEQYGIKKNTAAVWRCTRRYALPYVKLGRMVRYRRADIEVWLLSRLQNKAIAGGDDE